MEIDKKPDVFDHPDLCMREYNGMDVCPFLNGWMSAPKCLLFPNSSFMKISRKVVYKLPECQKLYKQADMRRHLYLTQLIKMLKKIRERTPLLKNPVFIRTDNIS